LTYDNLIFKKCLQITQGKNGEIATVKRQEHKRGVSDWLSDWWLSNCTL